jgi:hypothetical protein
METSRTFLVILQDFRKKRQNFVDNPIEFGYNMDFIQIYDNTQKTIVSLMIDSNKTLGRNYFIRSFPDATGLIYKDKNLNRIIRSVGKQRKEYFLRKIFPFFSVPMDQQGNFKWEWDSNIIYDLIYRDSRKRNT